MWINEKRITPLQLMIVVIGIFYFIYDSTTILQEQQDMVRVMIYAGILVATASAGISMINVKEIANKIKDIMQDRNMNTHEKLNAMMGVAIPLLSNVGELWDTLNKEQFDIPKKEPPEVPKPDPPKVEPPAT